MRSLLVLFALTASAVIGLAQTPPPPIALRVLPYEVPAGSERAAYFTPEGELRNVELTPNNPSLRFRVAGGPRVYLYEPPSAELTARIKAKLAAEGRPNAPVRYAPDQLTPLAEIVFQAPAPRALAILFPTGRDRPRLLGHAMSDEPSAFRPGCRRIFNLTQREIGARLGRREVSLRPLSVMDVGPIAEGDRLVFVPAEIWHVQDGARQPLSASRWAHDPNQRTVVFIYEDVAEGRVRIQACSERTDIPEPGDAPAAVAVGFGSRPVNGKPAVAGNKPAEPAASKPVPLTEAEAAEKKARDSVDSTNFVLPSL